MPYLSLPMGCALADTVGREMYPCSVPEKLKSYSEQQQREDVLHSLLLASVWMARAQICEGWRNQRRFPTLLSNRSLHSAAEALWVPPCILGTPELPGQEKDRVSFCSASQPGRRVHASSQKCNTTGVLLSLPSPPQCWASPRTEFKLGKEGSAPLGLLSTSWDKALCSCWLSSFAACHAYTPLRMGASLPCSWLGPPKPVVRGPAVPQPLVQSSTCPAWASETNWFRQY